MLHAYPKRGPTRILEATPPGSLQHSRVETTLDPCSEAKAQLTRVELRGLEPLTPTLPVGEEFGCERPGASTFALQQALSTPRDVIGRWLIAHRLRTRAASLAS